MREFELAHLNIARMKEPLDSPGMADFVANLERINALAEQAPGFIWRLKDEAGDATSFNPLGPEILVNLSVWEDPAALKHYVYHTAHAEIMRRRQEWFERMDAPHLVLWWVRKGHRPALAEAIERLQELRAEGPSAAAFTFRPTFPPPHTPAG